MTWASKHFVVEFATSVLTRNKLLRGMLRPSMWTQGLLSVKYVASCTRTGEVYRDITGFITKLTNEAVNKISKLVE